MSLLSLYISLHIRSLNFIFIFAYTWFLSWLTLQNLFSVYREFHQPHLTMAPPKFGDLGKAAKDLLNKEYHHPNTKLEISTKTKEGVSFKINVANGGKADFETKFVYKPFGATVTEKWNTSNLLAQTISFNDHFVQGLKVDYDCSYNASSGEFKGKVTKLFQRPQFTINSVVDVAASAIALNGVFAYEKFVFGGASSYNYSKGSLGKHTAAVGYSTGESTVHAVTDLTDKVSASIHHKVSSDLQAAVNVDVAKGKGGDLGSTFSVGGQYKLDGGAFVKAKINNDAHLALAYTHAVSKGATLGLSMLVDTANINDAAHKFGFNLVLNA